jgi:hypothetical protein
LVRKKWRTSDMFFNVRRGCPVVGAKAASVPTLTSIGLDDVGVVATGVVVPDFSPTAFLMGRLAGVSALATVAVAATFFAVAVLAGRVARLAGVALFVAFFAAVLVGRLVGAERLAATALVGRFARLAGATFFATFFAVVFVARRDRTGRSVMVCTSLLAWEAPH